MIQRTDSPKKLHEKVINPYLRDFLYGAMDGVVTTFAVVCGVAGADLSSGIVVVLGLANLIGDGFSMGVSNYMGTRSEIEQRVRAYGIEKLHLQKSPVEEREIIKQVFAEKGFAGADLDRAVQIITQDQNRWVEEILQEVLGLGRGSGSPLRSALVTFLAFILVGLLPVMPFLYDVIFTAREWHPFLSSCLMTGLAFILVGSMKSRFLQEPWYKGAMQSLTMGGAAAAIAYFVAVLLRDLAHVS